MALTKVTYSMISGAFVNVLDYGADPTGAINSQPACQAAIDACRAAGGGTVYFPQGIYNLTPVASPDSMGNGLLIEYTSQHNTNQRIMLVGEGRATVLRPGAADMYVIRLADSYCAIENLSIINSGSFANVSGIGIVPENTTQTTSVVYQNWNVLRNLFINGCAEGIEMRCGPNVGGGDSGCWYNGVYDTHIYSCTRGIFLRNPNGSTSGSSVNRNNFYNIRIGENTNTGIFIEAGSTNKFFGVDFEGIANGTSPSATPTAIKIAATGSQGATNYINQFYGTICEGNTRDVDNESLYTNFVGCYFNTGKVAGAGNYGITNIGSDGPTSNPINLGGMVIQGSSQIPGVDNGTTFYTQSNKATVDLQGRIKSTASFEEKSGNSGTIANGATYAITGLTLKRTYLLSVYADSNYGAPGLYLLGGDGTNNMTVATLAASTQATVAGTAATAVTLTNASGVNATIYWVVTPLGTPGA